jgi:hypothetical protein
MALSQLKQGRFGVRSISFINFETKVMIRKYRGDQAKSSAAYHIRKRRLKKINTLFSPQSLSVHERT